MAKPPASYGALVKLKTHDPSLALEAISPTTQPQPPPPLASRNRPMETKSDPTVLYLHPDGKYELKRYALARGPKVKVHDLLLEAVEEWAERHGIAAPFRVPSERQRKQ